MTLLYSTQATALGGRAGSVASIDGRLRAEMSVPKALGGDDGTGTNPEQLLAAAYAASFLCAIKEAGTRLGASPPPDTNVTAKVELSEEAGVAAWQIAITLSVDLPSSDTEGAMAMVEAAKRLCPLLNATDCAIAVRVLVS